MDTPRERGIEEREVGQGGGWVLEERTEEDHEHLQEDDITWEQPLEEQRLGGGIPGGNFSSYIPAMTLPFDLCVNMLVWFCSISEEASGEGSTETQL